MFLTLMVVGLVGLLMMAVPAFRHHGPGHAHLAPGGRAAVGVVRAGGGHAAPALRGMRVAHEGVPADALPTRLLRFVPSPRAVCSVLALYGAFGNAFVRAFHLGFVVAALLAAAAALTVERFVVRPIWNLVFRFEGQPSSPLEALLLCEARAVVGFRNGRGLVSVVLDGRVVQLSATLREDQAAMAVKVGDRLRVEDVDARRERVTVSITR